MEIEDKEEQQTQRARLAYDSIVEMREGWSKETKKEIQTSILYDS